MIAFHGDKKIKDFYLERVRNHAKADEIIKGKYWEKGKGCAVGCTIHSGIHSDYEKELGIPRILARLEDGIFEGLPNDLAMNWPEQFLLAIPIGADLSKVWNKFAYWLLVDETHGVLKFAIREKSKISIQLVAKLYLRSLKEEVSTPEWSAAATAAATAADAAAADAAAAAAAAYAADAYADAAAADAAAAAAAAYAREKSRINQSEKLLELLREAPVGFQS